MSITQNLSDAWRKVVQSHKIVNVFDADHGNKIEFGIAERNGELVFYARKDSTGEPITATVEERTLDGSGFRLQYNEYRALKPGGKILHPGRQPDISADVKQCRFYCQNPSHNLSLLNREPIAFATLNHWCWIAYYNAAPIEPEGHFLWLPASMDRANFSLPHLLQELTLPVLEDILNLFRSSSKLIFFYNSLHAGASVNHLHWQAVIHKEKLAVENASVRKSANNDWYILQDYPAKGLVCDPDIEPIKLFRTIELLQNRSIPFNLVLIGERICLFPRDENFEVVKEFPGGVVASMELAGKVITVDKDAYRSIRLEDIETAFHNATISIDDRFMDGQSDATHPFG
jgi:hypothetical protein